MPKTSTIPFTRPPHAARFDRDDETTRLPADGERLERPLSTVPYPVEPCHGVCLDTRDVEEEDVVRYRTARW